MVKQFRELQASDEWGFYVTAWKRGMQRSTAAKLLGFDNDAVIEGAITAFVNAAIDENIKRFAFAHDAPYLVTCNGRDWHELQKPGWVRTQH